MSKEFKSTFLIKQRAFLKMYLIHMAENNLLYGLEFKKKIESEFESFGYKPTHSEIYKSLHELLEAEVVTRRSRILQGKRYQEVVYYEIKNPYKAYEYKKMIREELNRCKGLIEKAILDLA